MSPTTITSPPPATVLIASMPATVATPQPATVLVPVSSPAHPSHISWLQILLGVLRAATAIGPAVVTIVDPKDAAMAQQVGALATQVEAGLPGA